jgi:hypothetical protein
MTLRVLVSRASGSVIRHGEAHRRILRAVARTKVFDQP